MAVMVKRIAQVVLVTLGLVASAVQAEPSISGVWQGTIGSNPVHACFPENGYRGAYYYDKYKAIIPLGKENDDSRKWREGYDQSGAIWRFQSVSYDSLRATWTKGSKQLPITLQRLPITGKNEEAACASSTFNGPRLVYVPRLVRKDQKGKPYIDLKVDFGPVFSDTYKYTGFLLRGTTPEVKRANEYLLKRARQAVAQFYECNDAQMSSSGTDGEYETYNEEPEIIAGRFLQWTETVNSMCAYPHPGDYRLNHFWDMKTGESVDFSKWFAPGEVDHDHPEDCESTDNCAIVLAKEKSRLAAFLLKRYKQTNSDRECIEAVKHNHTYSVSLAGDGLAFETQLPHYARACEDSVSLGLAELRPFLSPLGLDSLRSLNAAQGKLAAGPGQ